MNRPESTIEFELEIECQRVGGGNDFGIENGRAGIKRRVWQFGRIWLSVSMEREPHGRSEGGSEGKLINFWGLSMSLPPWHGRRGASLCLGVDF